MKHAVLILFCLLTLRVTAQHHDCDVVEYRADLTFDMAARHIDGIVDITVRNISRSPLREISLDLRDNTVRAVRVDDSAAVFSQNDTVLFIAFPRPVASLDTAVVTVTYGGTHGPVVPGTYGTGVQFGPQVASAKAQSSAHWYVSLTCHWLPCNNVFDDKAMYDITYDVPTGYVAAGQGTLIDEAYDAGRSRFRWRMRDPIHPHTAGWAVGPFFHMRDECAGLPVEFYVLKGFDIDVRDYFMRLPDMVATFEQAWGPCPAEKIGFAMTDAGSMETHTMILLDKADMHGAATPQLEAHELAHHWWGNCVTPIDLRENWLSEGFAMYGEILYRANTLQQGRLDRLMGQYASTYMRGIAASEGVQPLYDYRGHGAAWNYSSVIYIKGAVVLNMLRHYMGDSLYHAGIREYFRRYRYENVTSTMFRDVMAEYAGDDLVQFFQQWVYEPGWPILQVEEVSGGGEESFRLRVRQLQTARGWCLYEMPLELRVVTHAGETLRVTRWVHMLDEDVLRINEVSNAEVASWEVDPDGYMLVEYAAPTAIAQEGAATALRITGCYPQPGTLRQGSIRVEVAAAGGGTLQGELRDMLGRRVRAWEEDIPAGVPFHMEIDVRGLASGSYHMLLRSGDRHAVRTIVLQ
jgi:aminopeptidase N